MPTYDYSCPNCKNQIEVMHSYKDKPQIICDKCGAVMEKKFIPNAAIHIPYGFRAMKTKKEPWVEKKLEDFKEHPENDPYKKWREPDE